ncbi:DUF6607 family protein [Methylibium sp.]|uniref:DUF6607 family protein n=1 Tax=Methylibium sp. TaxID=2067992 RepID=UPI003D0D7360
MKRSILLLLALMALPWAALAYSEATPAAATSQFTFAWPLGESALKPRGASTRGVPVELDTAPGEAWKRLREPGLSDRERDRRAILAMAGPYRVSFDFLEVLRFDPALKPDAPYQSWGTEIVFVSEDRGDFIALQHVLVMRVQMEGGQVSEPIVVRHWRQEWRYQADSLLAYEGANTWVRRPVPAGERPGSWVQSVLQVDDSPRYAARGRWVHGDSFSTWIGDETWRPLPRREFSVRSDYQVLVGTNRHTITPSGWLQEENNLKLALGEGGRPRTTLPYLAREYGIARYERITGHDFSAGQTYFDRTEPFWAEVRAAWRRVGSTRGRFALRAPVDQGGLFTPFFDYAQELVEGKRFDVQDARSFIERTLAERYLVQAQAAQ